MVTTWCLIHISLEDIVRSASKAYPEFLCIIPLQKTLSGRTIILYLLNSQALLVYLSSLCLCYCPSWAQQVQPALTAFPSNQLLLSPWDGLASSDCSLALFISRLKWHFLQDTFPHLYDQRSLLFQPTTVLSTSFICRLNRIWNDCTMDRPKVSCSSLPMDKDLECGNPLCLFVAMSW